MIKDSIFNYFSRFFISPLLMFILTFQTFSSVVYSDTNPNTVERTAWFFNNYDTATSGMPSNIQYFKHFDAMPEEITMKIFDNVDLSHLAGKRLYVGYGMVDPKSGDCKVFPKEDTGYANDVTICLPWWRIEREYVTEETEDSNLANQILADIQNNTRPPIMFKHCKSWDDGKVYPGGKATCTSYYDKLASTSCWNNPKQSECWVDNCGQNMKDFCTFIGNEIGDTETLKSAVNDSTGTPGASDTKVGLVSHQYECPSGPLVEDVKCLDEESAIIYPQECETDVYEYCDEKRPKFDSDGSILGYDGTCSNGKEIFCEANKFNNATKVCKEPIYQNFIDTTLEQATLTRSYKTFEVDVLSGEEDIYMAKDNCLRANTVEDAREQELYVKIVGNGYLDDDIYVLRHHDATAHTKIYCNMQHNENHGNRKAYNSEILQCIDNNGNYAFNSIVGINVSDIISVQQNSENENSTGTPFALGRNHYGSTKLTIDDIEVAPETFGSNYPYYPKNGGWLRTWDNTTSTFSILFPFAGAYDIRFYNKNNQQVASASLGIEDFKEITQDGSLQLRLGRVMELASNIEDDIKNEDGTTTLNANRDDDWVEWGGGVFGGKHSKIGTASSSPNDAYVKENAVYNVMIKDLLTGSITTIPMVYPLPYPNRVFVSKLKVYEKRKYRCYEEFPEPTFLGGGGTETRRVCTKDQNYIDFQNGTLLDSSSIHKWLDDTLCQQNCRDHSECEVNVINNVSGYSCAVRGGEDIGGDLEGSLFSNKTRCDEQCYIQSNCVDFTDNRCNMVEEKVSEPVSDVYGKTVFRKKEVAYRCENDVQKQVGCLKWELKNNSGDASFNVGEIGVETFDFSSNFEKAVTHAANLEVGLLHIWSGWDGQCVYGKKWDSSYLSDPMTIVGYVMQAYAAYEDPFGALDAGSVWDSGTTSTGGATPETYNADTMASNTTQSAETGITGTSTDTTLYQDALNGLDSVGIPASSIDSWYDTAAISMPGDAITNGQLLSFGVRSAMILAAPPPEAYTMAKKLMKGYYGMGQDDSEIIAYNSCMASIGLSVPNLIAWGVGEDGDEAISPALSKPWEHPIRVTTSQIATIGSVAGELYTTSYYRMDYDENDFLTSLFALTPDAYIRAGEILCAGTEVAKAMTHINTVNNANSSGGGSNAGMQIAMMAIGYFVPVLGLVLSLVMDFMSNMWAEIDTCNDEEDAMQRDILEYKTQKFNKQEQCHFITTECDKEASFFGSKKCVRHRNEYCCYDMVLTRIFAEGLKAQLGKDWSSCNDITINDLKNVSFAECRDGQDPKIDKCMPTNKYSEFEQALFRQATKKLNNNVNKGLSQQVINSMAIPH
jgi:hypothetical protein